ncbi:MAG: mismatch-specific DNA-glycosylase [Chloroflexi bacterium]|nr:mismatch-specific DNA-glycosylase [Chloroflexota bacterium]
MILPDVLARDLLLVFCGTAASAASARATAYYANPGNTFWRALHQAGFTPRQFAPGDFRNLLKLGIGLTDLCKHSAGNDSDIAFTEQDVVALRDKLLCYQPKIAAFTSKTAWRMFSGQSASKPTSYGWQSAQVGQTRCFVLPSPSGSARRYWDIAPWQILADAYKRLQGAATSC